MADFTPAYKILEELEGFFSNHPADPGGRTWKGVARNYWPRWKGWAYIEQAIREHGSDWQRYAKEDPDLEGLVQEFYVEQFWNRIQGEKIQDQDVAEELFEQAVNMGVHRAVTHLQRAINLFSQFDKITEDGVIGPNTLEKLNTTTTEASKETTSVMRRKEMTQALLGTMNIFQGWYYITLASNPDTGHRFRKFLKGWINKRVKV